MPGVVASVVGVDPSPPLSAPLGITGDDAPSLLVDAVVVDGATCNGTAQTRKTFSDPPPAEEKELFVSVFISLDKTESTRNRTKPRASSVALRGGGRGAISWARGGRTPRALFLVPSPGAGAVGGATETVDAVTADAEPNLDLDPTPDALVDAAAAGAFGEASLVAILADIAAATAASGSGTAVAEVDSC